MHRPPVCDKVTLTVVSGVLPTQKKRIKLNKNIKKPFQV